MEVKTQIITDEKIFQAELNLASSESREIYGKLLFQEHLRTKYPDGEPRIVPLERKIELLEIAGRTHSIEEAEKALKMNDDWEDNSKDGRPPIGGAIDD